MKNKKTIILLSSILISLGLYNLIVFLVNKNWQVSFWVSYAFITLSILLFFISLFIMGTKENKGKVTGMPINVLSFLYFFFTFILGTTFMFFPSLSAAAVVIPNAVLFALFLLIFIPSLLTYYTKD